MNLDQYIAQECARDPEFAREYHSPERDTFIAGIFLHARRKEAGISLPILAKKARVPSARLRAFEIGEAAISYDEFCSLLDILGDSQQTQPLCEIRAAGRDRFVQLQTA
jgi:transcriptional regulator with XRE-family HTH domain